MPGSGFFPLALGLVLMTLASIHGIQLHLAKPKPVSPEAAPAPQKPTDGSTNRVLLFMAAVAAATALLEPLGYTLSAFLLMLALLQILGLRRWHHSALIALAAAGASYVVFVVWLKIPMPSGWLF
jgi:hypothetical protein